MTLPNESSSLTRGEKTKYRLAESMKECMCHTPVDAITVRQITENCGLTRQTFYRNFMDKFDLINWYFDKLLIKSFEYMGQGKTVQEGLQLKFSYIGEEKEFFRAAFRYDRQRGNSENLESERWMVLSKRRGKNRSDSSDNTSGRSGNSTGII